MSDRLSNNQVVLAVACCIAVTKENKSNIYSVQDVSKATGISWESCRRSLELLSALSIAREIPSIKHKTPDYIYTKFNPSFDDEINRKLYPISKKITVKGVLV